jgi:hypothetical protein
MTPIRFAKAGLAALGFPDPDLTYRVPDLSHLYDKNVLNVSLDRLTGNFRGPTAYPYFGIWMNLVRLTDNALRNYEAARGRLKEYREHAYEGRVGPFYLAIDHFEVVVSATHRAVLNAQRLDAAMHRKLSRPTNRQAELLRLARNHIEHMDEKLVKRSVKQGELHVLVPLTSRIQIGGIQVPYRDLASCIRKMYRNIELIRQAPSK